MTHCCIECFHDREIKNVIKEKGAVAKSQQYVCPYCNSKSSIYVDARILYEKFEFLLGCFQTSSEGKLLSDLMQDAFHIFNAQIDNKEKLLKAIFTENYQDTFYTLKSNQFQHSSLWAEFKNEIKHENRFFPKNSLYSSLFNPLNGDSIFFELLEQLTIEVSNNKQFYRARVSEKTLSKNEMSIPPKEQALGGRANPQGIPYLYLSNNIETCIAETRPSNGAKFFISKFTPKNRLKVLDLCTPKINVSISAFEENKLIYLLSYIHLLETLSKELSKPILPNRHEIDYIPTQFLCEFIKSVGKYDGILFNSSFGMGENYVFYDASMFDNTSPDAYIISKIAHSYLPSKY